MSLWYLLIEQIVLIMPSNRIKQISFAKTRSDAVVKKVDAQNFDTHKAQRDEHKSLLCAFILSNVSQTSSL
jgi:hypothetical protein